MTNFASSFFRFYEGRSGVHDELYHLYFRQNVKLLQEYI